MISLSSLITLAVSGMVVASPLKPTPVSFSRRQSNPVADCPDQNQLSFVLDAHTEALTLAQGAVDYINTNGATNELFITYFGIVQNSTEQLQVFTNAANEHTLTLFCTDNGELLCSSPSTPADGEFGAYGDGSSITFCPGFYNQVDIQGLCTGQGINTNGIRGATTLFVIAEDVGGIGGDLVNTKDCRDAQSLALSDPASARNNAENYIARIMTRVSW